MKQLILLFFYCTFTSLYSTFAQKGENHWQAGIAFGAEHKFTFPTPKIAYTRIHPLAKIQPYYGASGHLNLIQHPFFSGAVYGGFRYRAIGIEGGLSYLRYVEASDVVNPESRGPFAETWWNPKFCVYIKNTVVKFGPAFLQSEQVPTRQEKVPLFNAGRFNGRFYNLEVLFRINN
ncbi:MAG: hypothetical protein AAF960_03350 [Bacteroidota bacterium]